MSFRKMGSLRSKRAELARVRPGEGEGLDESLSAVGAEQQAAHELRPNCKLRERVISPTGVVGGFNQGRSERVEKIKIQRVVRIYVL